MWRLAIVVVLVGTAHAQPSSPGPLSTSHAHLDGSAHCNNCHVDGNRAVSIAKCIGCHGQLVRRGLHTTTLVAGKPCEGCHDEHEGRARDIQGWKSIRGGRQAFDHDALAGWPLRGGHAPLACTRCHAQTHASGTTKFAGLNHACASCHQLRSPHGSSFTLPCDRCHGDAAWKPAKTTLDFDHDRETKLPLVGAHRYVACAKCHANNRFALPNTTCATCHTRVAHQSPVFDTRRCDSCHSPTFTSFAGLTFDHDERTKFPLEAGHREPCIKCHTAKLGAALPSPKCESCHPTKNPHGKRFAAVQGGCAACHTAAKWQQVHAVRFKHGQQTKLALVGNHAEIACRACHRGTSPRDFEDFKGQVGCKECHAHAKVHADVDHPNGRYTTRECTNCHVTGPLHPPRPPIQIYHGPQSAFTLVKAHASVPCADCHTARSAKGKTVFDAISPECAPACHQDSLHRGTLGPRCTSCHVSGRWDAPRFAHTTYVLEGEHLNVACEGCHGVGKKFRGTPRRCSDTACHARDDVHRGSLGTACDRCHLANGDNRFNHTTMSKFELDGKHLAVTCDGCHPFGELKPRPMTCDGCHPDPAVHYRRYGSRCERCHTTASWESR